MRTDAGVGGRVVSVAKGESVMRANDKIELQIAATKRAMPADVLRTLQNCEKRLNVSVDSLIWLLTDSYPSGHIRSNAFNDCPACVVDDGLVIERFGAALTYTPWIMTEKAKDIVAKAGR